jgi:hypothetical protein
MRYHDDIMSGSAVTKASTKRKANHLCRQDVDVWSKEEL